MTTKTLKLKPIRQDAAHLSLVPTIRPAPTPPALQFNENISTGHHRYCWRYATYQRLTWSPVFSDLGEVPVFRTIEEASAAARAHHLPTGRMCVVGFSQPDWEARQEQWDQEEGNPLTDYHQGMRFDLAREKMLACKTEGIGTCIAHYDGGAVTFTDEEE